jgi:hypothetical protein
MKKIKVCRNYKGKFTYKVTGARWACAILLAIIFALIFAYCKREEERNFKFVSPIPEAKLIESLRVKTVLATEEVSDIQVLKMIVQEFEVFGPRVVREALDIAWCESKYKEKAENWNTNGSVDRGIFQISSIHGYSEHKLFAAWENINIAREMYRKQGWRPWVCARKLGIIK